MRREGWVGFRPVDDMNDTVAAASPGLFHAHVPFDKPPDLPFGIAVLHHPSDEIVVFLFGLAVLLRAERNHLSLPEIKSGYIGDGDRQGLDSKECFQRALPRAISAHPCSMTSECACRCNSSYTIAARGADDVRQIPRCDPCIPCGSNRSAVLHKRFAKVSEETSGDLVCRLMLEEEKIFRRMRHRG